jgi:glyoxylase-like metal-dependent hydrolase (beta-lactamase superfamily II)
MVENIAKDTYRISDYGNTNCFLIVGSRRALLIDIGIGFYDILADIRKITDKPLDVVCTHNHTDHLGGYGDFESIYIHRDDLDTLKKFMLSRFVRKILLLGSKINMSEKVPLKAVRKGKYKLNLIPVEDGHVFDLGDRKIEVLHSQGHTVGSIILFERATKLMFVGDNMCPSPWLFLPFATSVEEWLVEAKKIRDFSSEYAIWWGHEGGLLDPALIKRVCEIGDEVLAKYPQNKRFSTIKAYPCNDRINGSIVFRTGNVRKNK